MPAFFEIAMPVSPPVKLTDSKAISQQKKKTTFTWDIGISGSILSWHHTKGNKLSPYTVHAWMHREEVTNL